MKVVHLSEETSDEALRLVLLYGGPEGTPEDELDHLVTLAIRDAVQEMQFRRSMGWSMFEEIG